MMPARQAVGVVEAPSETRLRAVTLTVRLPARARGFARQAPPRQVPRPSDETVRRRLHLLPEGPMTRAECAGGARPCPLTQCRWNTATLKSAHLDAIPGNCVLDVADRGGSTLEEVGQAVGCTREGIRQIEEIALRKVRAEWARRAERARKKEKDHGR